MCGDDCVEDCLQGLAVRREAFALRLFKKTLTPTHILHSLSFKVSDSGRVILPFMRTKRCQESFFHKAAILYNSLTTR